jgi:hypothetical protein
MSNPLDVLLAPINALINSANAPVTSGPFLFPKPPPPASTLTVVNVGNSSNAFGWTIPALAGLLAKTQPRLAVSNAWIGAAASWGKSKIVTARPTDALKQFPIRNYILFQQNNQVQALCAVTISGVTGALPVGTQDESLYKQAVGSANKVLDLTGNTALGPGYGNNTAWNWLWNNYGSKVTTSFINMNANGLNDLTDYVVFAGAYSFDYISDVTLQNKLLNALSPSGAVIGFWQLSNAPKGSRIGGFGYGEPGTVSACSQKNLLMHAADRTPNTTYTASTPSFARLQLASPLITYNPAVKYVLWLYSQGDAWGYVSQNNWASFQQINQYPTAASFSISSALAALHPELFNAYYNGQTNYVDFVAGPSGGVGYWHPSGTTSTAFRSTYFQEAYKFGSALGIAIYFIIDTGFSTAQVLGAINAFPAPPSALLYWQLSQNNVGTTHQLLNNVLALRNGVAIDTSTIDSVSTVTSLIQQSARQNPFVYVIINTPSGVVQQRNYQVMQRLGSGYKAVTAEQFVELYKLHGVGG